MVKRFERVCPRRRRRICVAGSEDDVEACE